MQPKQIIIDGVIGTNPGEISASIIKAQLPTNGEPIELVIHSEGGSVFEGFAIFDAVNEHAIRVNRPFSDVARELLRCAVEDGKLDEYYPRSNR